MSDVTYTGASKHSLKDIKRKFHIQANVFESLSHAGYGVNLTQHQQKQKRPHDQLLYTMGYPEVLKVKVLRGS